MITQKIYIKPEIMVYTVESETGIATSSATLTPTGPNSDFNPEVNDWNDGGTETQSAYFD